MAPKKDAKAPAKPAAPAAKKAEKEPVVVEPEAPPPPPPIDLAAVKVTFVPHPTCAFVW